MALWHDFQSSLHKFKGPRTWNSKQKVTERSKEDSHPWMGQNGVVSLSIYLFWKSPSSVWWILGQFHRRSPLSFENSCISSGRWDWGHRSWNAWAGTMWSTPGGCEECTHLWSLRGEEEISAGLYLSAHHPAKASWGWKQQIGLAKGTCSQKQSEQLSWQSTTDGKMLLCCCCTVWLDRLFVRCPHSREGGGFCQLEASLVCRALGETLADIPAVWMNRNLHSVGLQIQTCHVQLNSLLWEQEMMPKVYRDAINKHPAPSSSPSASSQTVRSLGAEPLHLPSAWWLHLYLLEHRNARRSWTGIWIAHFNSRVSFLFLKAI